MFDYLIVGAGLFGAVCAAELLARRQRVLVIEKSDRIGGMCHTAETDGIICQSHGGHIFHTNDKRLWDYVNRYITFRQYSHHVKAKVGETVYSFPPNRMTYQQLGLEPNDPRAAEIIREKFFRGYSEKQWGRPLEQSPGAAIGRIPIRSTWNDEYFDDEYQGLPIGGYTPMIDNMLRGCAVVYGENYLDRRIYWDNQARHTIYTGSIDALYGYFIGKLEYRSLKFETQRIETGDYQGCPTMNYCDANIPFTRIHEHKHFYPANVKHTIISREYPETHNNTNEPYYPVDNDENMQLYEMYHKRAQQERRLSVGGRLGSYRYLDMHQTVAAALALVHRLTDSDSVYHYPKGNHHARLSILPT